MKLATWIRQLIERDNGSQMTLKQLAEETGFNYNTLKKAAQDGRLNAVKMGGYIWLSTITDVEQAVKDGGLQPLKGASE